MRADFTFGILLQQPDTDDHIARLGVLGNIGQAFLDDTIRRDVDAFAQIRQIAISPKTIAENP